MDGSRIAESQLLQRKNAKSLKSLRDVYMNSEEGCSLMIVSNILLYCRFRICGRFLANAIHNALDPYPMLPQFNSFECPSND